METHKIIQDERELNKFIDWLPDLYENESYYIVLQARKKYMPELSSSDTVEIQRFPSVQKDRIKERLRQLECPVGSYRTKKGQVVSNDGLVIYINTNPRSTRKASFELLKDLADHIAKGASDPNYRFNPARWADRQMHKQKSRTCHVHFDIDEPESFTEVINGFSFVCGYDSITVFETRGGCHVLVDPKKVPVEKRKTWYQKVKKMFSEECDQAGDLMLPIPGCVQGGFSPKMI